MVILYIYLTFYIHYLVTVQNQILVLLYIHLIVKFILFSFFKTLFEYLVSTKPDTHPRQTYSNNFGNTHLGIGAKGIDGFILNIIFKPFITRLNTMEEYLLLTDNIGLYSECRAFLVYTKENYGGIFRLTVFSSLLDPEKELKIIQQSIKKRSYKIPVSSNDFLFSKS